MPILSTNSLFVLKIYNFVVFVGGLATFWTKFTKNVVGLLVEFVVRPWSQICQH